MSAFQQIPGATKIKGVALFCLNENPLESSPFSVEVGRVSLCVQLCIILTTFILGEVGARLPGVYAG